jgi:hypothetical protein
VSKLYFKVDDDTQVEFDADSRQARTVRKSALRDEIAFLRAQLTALPAPVSNTELLAWAKANYPQSGQEQSGTAIKALIDEIQAALDGMKA